MVLLLNEKNKAPDFSWWTEMDFILLLMETINIKMFSFMYKNDILYIQQVW